jgi:hypothetical protein
MQKGVGIHAVVETLKKASAWGIFTLFIQLVVYRTKKDVSFVITLLWQLIILLFYGMLWLAPQKHLFRRPAAFPYAKAWFFFRIISLSATILFYVSYTSDVGNCVYVFGSLFPFALLEPLLIYFTLLQDSRWWQGFDIHQGFRNRSSVEEIRGPLVGIDLDPKVAQSLAAQVSGSNGAAILCFCYSNFLIFEDGFDGKWREK